MSYGDIRCRGVGQALVLMIISLRGFAGGFSLYTEGSAVEVGNFAAGSAAEAPDASIGWFNPAGLVLVKKQQALLSGVGVLPRTQITGSSHFATQDLDPYVQSFNSLSGAENALVPAIHYAQPLVADRVVWGLSVVSPFGLSTRWSESSPVRYEGTLTKLNTVNASPEIGVLLTEHWAVGLGLDMQWATVRFNAMGGAPTLVQYRNSFDDTLVLPATYYDTSTVNSGSSYAVGFHAGVMGLFDHQHARVGLNYQSSVNHRFRGSSVFSGRLADPEFTNPDAVFATNALQSGDTQLPSMVTLSGYRDLTEQWALLGSLVYTQWSVFKNIELEHVAAASVESGQAYLDLLTPQDYRDAWRLALGLNYHVNARWMLRVGGGYDQTPTVYSQRDVRLPDVTRWALSVGSHVQVLPALGVDVGYTHLFAVGQSLLHTTRTLDQLSSVTVNALATNSANLIGVQAVWAFDGIAESSPTHA